MRTRSIVALTMLGVALLAFAFAWWLPLPARVRADVSPIVRWQDGQVAHAFLASDDRWRLPVSPETIDPNYLVALLALEDERFWWHPGVDPIAVLRAVGQNLAAGEVVSGASTLTMQVARMAEARPRTMRSKIVEALRALQLEVRLSKSEILRAYLQLVPYGGNYEGVHTASWVFFGHGPDELSPAEISLLLAIPQDPNHRTPGRASARAVRAARDRVARRLAAAEAFSPGNPPVSQQEILTRVLETPVPSEGASLPRGAPHAASWIRGHNRAKGTDVTVSLDATVQGLAESVLERSRALANDHGVWNASIVVVEHKTGEVRALVGGFDFWSDDPAAQIPAFSVPRSPGSALKPSLVALAIDDGRVLGDTRLVDIPVSFGAYAPRNYDSRYEGLVRVDDALSRSLNVPFVGLMQQVGVQRFLNLLRRAGVSSISSNPDVYGLSVITGGIEISALELAGLYATLANSGLYSPLVMEPVPHAPDSIRVLSPGAAWLVRRILRLRDRPDFPQRAHVSAVPREILWKTGTSFGHRDAWAVGAGRRYTVAVWLGNLDRTPSRWLVGSEAAGPILFDVLEALNDGWSGVSEPPPDDLTPVEVCALSGQLPGAACPHRTMTMALEAKTPPARCALHKSIEVDAKTGERVGPGCRDGRQTEMRTVVVWPPDVRRWMSEAMSAASLLPPLAAGCFDRMLRKPPVIRSPEPGLAAVLLPGLPAEEQSVALVADVAGGGEVDWYVDGVWVARVPSAERAWWTPRPGKHEIVAIDQGGRKSHVSLRVMEGRSIGASPPSVP